MDFDDFQSIIEGATDLKGPKSEFADIDKLFESTFQAPAFDAARAGIVDTAETTEANAVAAARQEKADIEERIQELRAKMDPRNYKKEVNIKDGGFDFFDPDGQPISPIEYARIQNVPLLDVLEGSTRASDLDFREDYEAVINLNLARESGDLDSFFEEYPELKPARKELLKLNNDQLLDLLFKQYPQALQFGEEPVEAKTIEAGINPVQKVLDLIPFVDVGRQQDTFLNAFPKGNRFD